MYNIRYPLVKNPLIMSQVLLHPSEGIAIQNLTKISVILYNKVNIS